nr:FaeA/PapI family transcriptional regulator [Mediterraneibacter faecis]
MNEVKEQVYEYLISFISDVGYPPTVREIADHFHISTSTARYYLNDLEKLRLIEMHGVPRGIKVIGYKFVKE